jgi:quercetin dioxygenase-like cupin family protein
MSIKTVARIEWSNKIWGRTKAIALAKSFEVHELEVKEGGYCSRHRHRKWNRFHVIEGEIIVEFFGHENKPWSVLQVDRILKSGDHLEVPPGQWHRFRATEDSHLLEIYWVADIDPGDIERADEGGLLNEDESVEPTDEPARIAVVDSKHPDG